MESHRTSLFEGAILVLIVIVLAALFIPFPSHRRQRATCQNNLAQLYKLGIVYSMTHEWPGARGSALWSALARTQPPLIDKKALDVLRCPRRDDPSPGESDYLGPAEAFATLRANDPLAADRPDNHGDDQSVNVLLKDGSVMEVEAGDPLLKKLVP